MVQKDAELKSNFRLALGNCHKRKQLPVLAVHDGHYLIAVIHQYIVPLHNEGTITRSAKIGGITQPVVGRSRCIAHRRNDVLMYDM